MSLRANEVCCHPEGNTYIGPAAVEAACQLLGLDLRCYTRQQEPALLLVPVPEENGRRESARVYSFSLEMGTSAFFLALEHGEISFTPDVFR